MKDVSPASPVIRRVRILPSTRAYTKLRGSLFAAGYHDERESMLKLGFESQGFHVGDMKHIEFVTYNAESVAQTGHRCNHTCTTDRAERKTRVSG